MNLDPRSDDPRIEMLSRAARTIHVPPLDVGDVVRAARSRRRRGAAMVASAVAVTVTVAGVVLVAPNRDGRAPARVDAATARDATGEPGSSLPAPPAGTKWVGQDGVLVAVPTDWAVTEHPCGVDAVALVFDGTSEPTVDCTVQGGQVATVRFDPLREGAEPVEPVCLDSFPELCEGSRVFDDDGMAAQVTVRIIDRDGHGDGEQRVRGILDSAIAVPAGWTTVPFGWGVKVADRQEALAAAGLEVEVIDRDRINNYEANLSPQGGTVVQVGTTVTLAPIDLPALDLTCARADQVGTDLDVPGPGRPTPAEAVAPYADGLALTTQVGTGPQGSGRQAEVSGTDTGGVVRRVFGVTERDDGWWPDSYTACRTPAPAGEAPGQDQPAAGCSEVEVSKVSAEGGELVATLSNSGTGVGDLVDLEVSVTLGTFALNDRARADDFASAMTALPPGADAVLHVATGPGCQFGGAQFTISLRDGTVLTATHPGDPAQVCIRRGPQMELTGVE